MPDETTTSQGSKRLWIFAIAAVLIGSIVAAVAVAVTSSSDGEDEPEVADRASVEDEEALDEWFLDEDGDKPERVIEDVPAGDPARGWQRGKGREWRDPTRRAERLRRRFQIESLGGSPAAITHEEVWEAFREVRPRMRECIEAAGGMEALRQGFGNRPRGGRTVRLDVGSDGRVIPGSVSFEPQAPDEIATCMKRELEGATFENAGPEGVRITMTMGGRRNRFAPDGGLERGERRRGREISPGSAP